MGCSVRFFDKASREFLARMRERVFPSAGRTLLVVAFSALFALSYVLGYALDGMDFLRCLYYFALYAVVTFGATSLVLYVLMGREWLGTERDAVGALSYRSTFIVLLACFVAVYVVILLVYYPGCCTSDSEASMSMVLGWKDWSNWHPLLFTFTVAPFALLGQALDNLYLGIALYSFVQLCAMAAVCAYGCCWLRAKGVPSVAVVACALFFAFNPVIQRYAVTMWKDVPFALCMFLYALLLFDIVASKGVVLKSTSGLVRLIVLSLLVSLYRNNGLYAVVVTLALLAWIYRATLLRRLAPVAIAVPVAVLVATGPVAGLFGVAPSPFQESVAVPLQQLARVVSQDGNLTEGQREILGNLLPLDTIKERYKPTTSDEIKFAPEFDSAWLDDHKMEFLKLWLNVGLQNPATYFWAWAAETDGYWNIDVNGWAVVTSGAFGEPGINLVEQLFSPTSLPYDLNDSLDEIRFSHLLYGLFNIACSVWLVLFLVALKAVKGSKADIVPYMPLIVLWLSLLVAAPDHAQFRYMFSFHLLLPVLLASAFFSTAKPDRRMWDGDPGAGELPSTRTLSYPQG